MTASKTSIVRLLAGSGCALLLFLGCAQRPDPSTVNKQAVRDAFAAMDQQDYARLRTLLPEGGGTDKPLHVVGSPPMNRDELLAFLQTYWKSFPDTKHAIHELIAEGDTVVARVVCEGTHRGAFEGLPASGKTIRYDGVHIVRCAEGRIQTWWCLDDNLGMMQQLGLQLAPAKTAEPPAKAK